MGAMTNAEVMTLIEHFGIAGVCIALWLLERRDHQRTRHRLEVIEAKLIRCLDARADQGPSNDGLRGDP